MKNMRKAIAMIELIFAIVVIGIIMLSAPMLVSRATQSSYTGLQQEAITAAATQISQIMTAAWDQADANISEGMPVLQTSSAAIANCNTSLPTGVSSSTGRYCNGLTTTAGFFNATPTTALLGKEGTKFDDIDDYDDSNMTISTYNAENIVVSQGDYIDRKLQLYSTISYGDDQPRLADGTASPGGYKTAMNFSNPFTTIAVNSSNIKLISVTLKSESASAEIADKEITLSAFMCNIGAPKRLINSNGP